MESFQEVNDTDGDYRATCNYCGKVLIGNYSSGTTHLKTHFTSCLRKNFKHVGQLLLAKKNDGSLPLRVVLK